MSSQVSIDPMAAYAEATALSKYYHDRNLLLANQNATLLREKAALETEKEQLLTTVNNQLVEIEALKNGNIADQT